ncbi:MAG: DUF362 domain-containing protein [Sedimentisphaerales bacterium]|nr:DUF362 domain-containing protein [Sedimentisphaerales bacterium]
MASQMTKYDRRSLLKGFGIGAAYMAVGRHVFAPKAAFASARSAAPKINELYQKKAGPAKVAILKGNDRREIVRGVLDKIKDDIIQSIGNKKILLKPNFVATNVPLCATHIDETRAILDFLKDNGYDQQITIGESPAGGGAMMGFQNYGYTALEKEYNVKLVELDQTPTVYRFIMGRENAILPVRIISMFLDPDVYVISAAKMKTHDRALTTLSLKNVLMGSPAIIGRNDNSKQKMHQTQTQTPASILHFNLFQLATQGIYPDLGVVDGFEAMEGDGPINGTPLDAKIAFASLDPLALDCIGTKMMLKNFDPMNIGYLKALAQAGMGQADLSKITVLGESLENCQYNFTPHEFMGQVYQLS